MKRFALFLSVGLVAILALAACGGDDDNGNGDDNGGGDGTSLSMEMGEMYFDPDSIDASPGDEVSIDFNNEGTMLHDFTIDDLGGERIHVEVASGESDSTSFTIPDDASGEIEFYCTVPGHREGGMEGVINVN